MKKIIDFIVLMIEIIMVLIPIIIDVPSFVKVIVDVVIIMYDTYHYFRRE